MFIFAVAIVAETCSPFTVLPALMNEYRVPELNVQNGVLKVCVHVMMSGLVHNCYILLRKLVVIVPCFKTSKFG